MKEQISDEKKHLSMERFVYGIVFLVLFGTEVLIALYVHDAVIRPYVGDMLVVIVLYCLIRVFIPRKCHLLPLWIFLLAVGVEVLQYFNLVELLGVSEHRILKVVIGSVFDWKDIACYAVGCVVLAVWEIIRNRRSYSEE